jgi:hypothetical protein
VAESAQRADEGGEPVVVVGGEFQTLVADLQQEALVGDFDLDLGQQPASERPRADGEREDLGLDVDRNSDGGGEVAVDEQLCIESRTCDPSVEVVMLPATQATAPGDDRATTASMRP